MGIEGDGQDGIIFAEQIHDFLVSIRRLVQVPPQGRQCITVSVDRKGSTKQGHNLQRLIHDFNPTASFGAEHLHGRKAVHGYLLGVTAGH